MAACSQLQISCYYARGGKQTANQINNNDDSVSKKT